jgi:hypothetical protein
MCIFLSFVPVQGQDFPVLKGEYLGQKTPGMIPEIFAPGIISTEKRELNSVFSPNGREFYFTLWTESEGYRIMVMKKTENEWTKPEVASFSGKYVDFDMCFSSDGKKLFFCSKRPVPGVKISKSVSDIWFVKRTETGWGEPVHLGYPVNSGSHQVYPTLTLDGTLYFSTMRDDNIGKRDIYKSKLENGAYRKIKNLGNAINSVYDEGDTYVAFDESFMIINSRGRPDDYGKGDLYISLKLKNGKWSKAKNMGKQINSNFNEYCPILSHDGKYLFFTSTRTGNGDIYWVDANILEKFKLPGSE